MSEEKVNQENVEKEESTATVTQPEVRGRGAKDLEDLARKINAQLCETIQGDTWAYAILKTNKALIVVKYLPRVTKYLYTRGLIAIGKEDLLKVIRAIERHGKQLIQDYIRELANKLGVEINVKE